MRKKEQSTQQTKHGQLQKQARQVPNGTLRNPLPNHSNSPSRVWLQLHSQRVTSLQNTLTLFSRNQKSKQCVFPTSLCSSSIPRVTYTLYRLKGSKKTNKKIPKRIHKCNNKFEALTCPACSSKACSAPAICCCPRLFTKPKCSLENPCIMVGGLPCCPIHVFIDARQHMTH